VGRSCAALAAGVVVPAAIVADARAATDADELRTALWWEPLEGKAVRCTLCPRRCVVPEGGRGYCRVRANRGGRYVTLVYGRACTTHVDPIEKKPFFHVYPGTRAFSLATVGCNLHCKFCQNWDISQASPGDFPVPYTSPAEIAAAAKKSGARTIAYTYSEPTVFHEYMADCAAAAAELGVGSVVVSSGFIADAPHKALFPRVQAIKIDLKSFREDFYRDVCDAELRPVLDTLKRLAGSGVWYEIVNLLIPTLNDTPDELKRMAAWIVKELGPNVPLHFSRYHPMYKLRNLPPTPLETVQKARALARAEGCRYVYTGNAPGAEGENTACHSCGEVLIRRYGYALEQNRLANGKCPKCGTAIPGLWA
jgi:pyruvate formate lyase activating enzyme